MLQRQQEILDIIDKLVKCFENLLNQSIEVILKSFQSNRVIELVEEIEKYYESSLYAKKYVNAMPEILSVKASAVKVKQLAEKEDKRARAKLEFELLPLIENLRLDFYYQNWIDVYPEKKQNFFDKEVSYYNRNRYLDVAKKSGAYKYDLSICVTAFNKLEVTQKCIESLYKYFPTNISYELIFLNHGSSDGTREYFESKNPDKQMDIEVNGGGASALYRILEGKYRIWISNDVLVTKNSIENMYRCIESDEGIGWVVATTPNVSNLQSIETNFKTIKEMYQFAEKNNVSDSKRWEERVRLCNPIDLCRVDDWFNVIFKEMMIQSGKAFPDDRISQAFRQMKYKLILAKDAFCYHFGSVTHCVADSKQAQIKYTKGRIEYIKELGIDPWGYGFCFDPTLIKVLKIKLTGEGNLLGINSGMGGNLLKIRTLLKENAQIENANITFLTQYEMNYKDQQGLGDETIKVNQWTEFSEVLSRKYDYIVLENGIDLSQIIYIHELKSFLTKGGLLYIRTADNNIAHKIQNTYSAKAIVKQPDNIWLEILN